MGSVRYLLLVTKGGGTRGWAGTCCSSLRGVVQGVGPVRIQIDPSPA